jgi:hypothetical protein
MRLTATAMLLFAVLFIAVAPRPSSGYTNLPTMAEGMQPTLSGAQRAVAALAAALPEQAAVAVKVSNVVTEDSPPKIDPSTIDDMTIKRANSLSATQIDSILATYGSPAVGMGQAFYDEGKKRGIDDAYAVAFFIHESGAGTAGAAVDNKSTGNIVCAGWHSCPDGRFRRYASWEEGIVDWYRLIDVEYVQDRGITDINAVIPIYAPSFENDVQGYQNVVAQTVAGWRRANATAAPAVTGTHTTILPEMPEPSGRYDDWNCALWNWKGNGTDCRHYGTDYAAPEGTPVRVPDRCIFINSATETTYGGGMFQCELSYGTLYVGHIENIQAHKEGDVIPAGTQVATVGPKYPQTTGPHVHVQLIVNNKVVDWEKSQP